MCIRDRVERNGRVLAETGFIIDQLARGTDLLPPEGTDTGDRVRYWLHFAEGSAMPPLVTKFALSVVPEKVPALVRPIARMIVKGLNNAWLDPDLARLTAFWEDTLAEGGWFAGDRFTAADVMMSYPVEMAALRGSKTRPATADWLSRIHDRPAYRRALEAGGADFSGARAA